MSNNDVYRVVKNGGWFELFGPESSTEPELRSIRSKKLAKEMLDYDEIVEAYHKNYVVFDDSISEADKLEMLEILNDDTASDYFIDMELA